jgi:hypothetical protein
MADSRHIDLIAGEAWAAQENRCIRLLNTPVAAAGTAIGNAAEVSLGRTPVSNADNTAAVRLPAPAAVGPQTGHEVTVYNLSNASSLVVFPNVGAAIGAASANAAVNMAAGTVGRFTLAAADQWMGEFTAAE